MKNKHLIINIGRQVGSGGRIIADLLAKEFECTLYDKGILNLAAKESGFCEKFFEQNDEQKGFMRALFHTHVPILGESNFYRNNISQESLFQFQSDAIRKAAEQGSCVFVGRCADYVLRDRENTVNVFITADMDERVQRVCDRKNITKGEARKLIEYKESERASYYNYYTGKKWGHSTCYDLCVNSSLLGIDATVELIAHYIRKRFNLSETAE
uniref:Cytidylate kinase-like family protein n=1 Tax=Prevotella sp. GTC17259 TaxID=3236795 RepID=A0AB33J9A0_9BACT